MHPQSHFNSEENDDDDYYEGDDDCDFCDDDFKGEPSNLICWDFVQIGRIRF